MRRRLLYVLGALAAGLIAAFLVHARNQEVSSRTSDGQLCTVQQRSILVCQDAPEGKPWVYVLFAVLCALAGIILLVMACSSNIYRLKQGIVLAKRYDPAHTRKGMFVGTEIGDTNIVVGQQLPDEKIPAVYWVQLQDPSRPLRTGWVKVTRYQYNMARRGQSFNRRTLSGRR